MSENGATAAPAAALAPAILVVDDNAAKRLALRAMLAPLGHIITEADSGRAALRAVLRERCQSGLTPIIFVTAFGRNETETATAYASGAVDFIFTPIRAEVLRAKVTAFVDLFVQSQTLQRSLESITALNAAKSAADAATKARELQTKLLAASQESFNAGYASNLSVI